MYKYIILIICLLIIFNRWNFLIFLLLALLTFYIVKNVLTKAKQENNKIIENMFCRKSDIHNPMGNVLLYTKEDELEYNLCKNQDIEKNLRFNVYNNRKDLFLRKNNVRSFVTMPSLYFPNDIDNFKTNIYNFNKSSCKLDGTNCMYNENIKYHKNYFLKK